MEADRLPLGVTTEFTILDADRLPFALTNTVAVDYIVRLVLREVENLLLDDIAVTNLELSHPEEFETLSQFTQEAGPHSYLVNEYFGLDSASLRIRYTISGNLHGEPVSWDFENQVPVIIYATEG